MDNKKQSIKFYSHGACQEVTGSKHFLDINGKVLQVDSGMFQGRREASYLKNRNLAFNPADVDAILLTHGHFDHSGALPIMVKNGFNGNIYSTPATRDIANIIMRDSAYIQAKDFEYLTEKKKKRPERKIKLYKPLYDIEDALKTLGQFVTISYHRKFYPLPSVEAEFFDAGHILGSSMIRLNINGEMMVGMSGDLGRENLPILKDPEYLQDLDYLVLEGTYGNRLHDSFGMASEKLAAIVKDTYAKNGRIVIPAFTIERTQEIIYILHQLTKEKIIPEVQIYVDSPMAVNATSIFKVHPECFDKETFDEFLAERLDPFGFDNIKYVTSVKESREINETPGPAIIISASGMAETGRILHHLKNNIEDPNTTIAIVGFMAAHTLGRKLLEGQKHVKIFGKEYTVNASVKALNAFSAHADYNEISDWLKHMDLDRLKKIFLVHGEKNALKNLKGKLLSMGVRDVEIVKCQEEYMLE
jgi:metallo-beta-lactamase family protein